MFRTQLVTLLALALALLVSVSAAELKIDVTHLPEGCKLKTRNGDKLSMHYTGTLDDGSKFDSSRDRNQPLDFTIGKGQVIQGWEQGLLDMCVGEKRILTIPSSLGYGARGFPPVIPADATLTFDVELVAIKNRKEEL
ncbi:FK506-binding protein 2 [Vanrija pseudolonga]|uniref:peptidylprolyl isomerase n=1 Tax=Vanrija pseudolonga TaxID=143232 RepID=A0AAF0Y0B4_9TREE|nr:FK506-binding protein 2 [Vanrija pseudolonga]